MRTYHVFSRARKNAKGKETDITNKSLLRMSMTISRKLAGVNGLKDLLNEPLMPKELHKGANGHTRNSISN